MKIHEPWQDIALPGGWINVLVTDTGTAAALLQRDAGTAPKKDDHGGD
jgi:hypothetical protein